MDYSIIKEKFFVAAILLCVTLIFTACSDEHSQSNAKDSPSKSDTAAASAENSEEKEYQDAPDFTLQNQEGNPFTLSEYEGKVVVLNVWATWCAPCRKEIPDFVEIQKDMRDDGVLFVGVSEDKEGWEVVRPFIKKYNINYPIVVDDGTIYRKYGPFRGIPTTFVINRKGKVAYAGTGMLSGDVLRPALEELVNE